MSISSATIQMFRAVRDLVHASSSCKRHQDRLSLCVESLTRSSSQLRDMLLSHSFVPVPQVPQHSSSLHSDMSHSPSSLYSKPAGEKEGDSSCASVSCSSWEKVDGKKGYVPLETGEGLPPTPQDGKQEKHGRLSMSPQGSPKMSAPDGHHSSRQSLLKTSSKSSKKDKDGSRSPRTKEKRHRSSTSSSSSSSLSSTSHHQHHLDSHHSDKEKFVDSCHGEEKQMLDKGNKQQMGEDNFSEKNKSQESLPTDRDSKSDIDNFFFAQTESASLLSVASKPQTPGSRPTSMEVDLVLASLAPDSPGTVSSSDDAGHETLAGLRELDIDGAALGNIPETCEEDSSRL